MVERIWGSLLLIVLTGCAEMFASRPGRLRRHEHVTTTRTWVLATEPSNGPLELVLEREVTHSRTVPPFKESTFDPNDGRGRGLRFVLRNDTKMLATILWDRSTFIDASRQPHRVIREIEGPRAINGAQRPTAVPPGAELQDEVYPEDCWGFSASGVSTRMFLPVDQTAAELQLVLVVMFGDDVLPISQGFRISALHAEEDRRIDTVER